MQPPLFVYHIDPFLQWSKVWGLSGLNSLTCRPQPRLQPAQPVPPVTDRLALEAEGKERDLCVSELWPPFPRKGKCSRGHFTLHLSLAVWPSRALCGQGGEGPPGSSAY